MPVVGPGRSSAGRAGFVLLALGLDARSRGRLLALLAALFQPPDGVASALNVAARVFRAVFAPDVFLRQCALAAVLHVFLSVRRYLRKSIRFSRFRLGSDRDWAALDSAASYDEYERAARAIDSSSPAVVAWKLDPRSAYFTTEKVQTRIDDLARYRRENNVYELLYTLRSRQYRTQFNIGRAELYAHSLTGTKQTLEEYVEATIGALHYIKEMGLSGLPSKDGLVLSQRDVLAFMNETRHAYGRTALHLSGGAALGVHHLGVLKAMLELRMLPRVLSGTSAGSIIAAIAGVRTHAELEALLFSEGGELAAIVTARKFFEPMQNAHDGGAQGGGAEEGPLDKGAGGAGEGAQPAQPGAWARLMRLLHSLLAPRGPVLNVDTLGETIRELVGDCTFLQAFNATGRILNIMVSRTDGREPMLLNYLTAPHVLVWSACRASSAVPGIFAPCELWARGPSGQSVPLDELKFTDGCVDSDLPKARLTELFNINFFIVSQVNPAATLLSTKAVNESGIATGGLTALLLRMLRAEVSAYIRTASELSVGSLPFKTTLSRIFNVVVQEYDGDLNLYPAYPMSDLLHMIDNPTAEYLGIATLRGQRAVWTRASQLRSLCRIEFEMDAICHELQSSLAPSRPESLAASRRPSMEHNSSAAAQPPANGALGLRRCGQIPSFNTLDMAAGGGAHQPPPPANAAAQAARKLLSRGRFSSTPLGLRSSAGNLNDLPPITSVASYLSLAQASDFVAPEEAGGAEPRQLIEAHRAPSFSDDARADEALLRALP